MAGDWIKMRTNLDTDPAVVRIASGLKLDRFAIVGRLHKIWAWANEHSVDGQDVPVDAEFLDSLVATPEFSAQLRSVGWLSGRDGSLSFPNFLRHNGDSAKQRALDAERKRKVRKQSEKCPDDNRTKSGPEKRREEKSNNNPQTPKGESWLIPESIQTEQFQTAWESWITYRKERKQKITQSQGEKLLKKFSEWGSLRSIAAIEHSILQGYQGIFEPNSNAQGKPPPPPPRPEGFPDVRIRKPG